MNVREIATRMTRAGSTAFIGGIVGTAVAVAMGCGSFAPSLTATPGAGSSAVEADDVGWNIVPPAAS